jgi:hypothetical protein
VKSIQKELSAIDSTAKSTDFNPSVLGIRTSNPSILSESTGYDRIVKDGESLKRAIKTVVNMQDLVSRRE